MSIRTENERKADSFDAEMKSLMVRAEMAVELDKRWAEVFLLLRKTRPLVREMMHAYDRQTTT